MESKAEDEHCTNKEVNNDCKQRREYVRYMWEDAG